MICVFWVEDVIAETKEQIGQNKEIDRFVHVVDFGSRLFGLDFNKISFVMI